MNKSRLEAFSDGVIAILITIMVLELKVPIGGDFTSLKPTYPVFLSYILSFIYLGIYWNNHHHMLHTVKQVNGRILWANLHLLFWLSLVPFVTAWMGENHFASVPVLFYGINLLMAAIAYYILQTQILRKQGKNSILAKAIGKDIKGKISPILYLIAIFFSFFNQWVSGGIYVLVALIWLVPDKRIERIINHLEEETR
ncbi:MAG TPA: TMEM175 family protein [Bacteroidales bacterium]